MIFVGFNGMLIILLLAFIRGFAGVKFDVTRFSHLEQNTEKEKNTKENLEQNTDFSFLP